MDKLLEKAYKRVCKTPSRLFASNEEIRSKILSVCKCERNKAPIRYLLSALLAKSFDAKIDTRQPYPKLGEKSFPGRTIDESHVQSFVHRYQLPCNDTTAFLMMDILDYVEKHPQTAYSILCQMLAALVQIKQETKTRMSQLVESLSADKEHVLSSEEITMLLRQHLDCKGSSRLPVLMVAAAYQAVQHLTKEKNRSLLAHNAADSQTGATGDIEITLQGDNNTLTCYEMKKKKVATDDIYVCASKISKLQQKPDNYIFITTDRIDEEVKELAASFYGKLGVEIAVLDCLGFINHFLHFFHRYRISFLDHYQQLVLDEPASAVSQPLKEAFLSLRRVAEL